MKKRRPYLLLEVMIAIALVALAAIPLLAPGIWMIKNEKEFNRQIRADQKASLLFANFVNSLYTGESFDIPQDFSFEFEELKDKGDEEKLQYLLYRMKITYAPKNGKIMTFPYDLFIEVTGSKSDS